MMNISQSFCITIGIGASLSLANYYLWEGKLTVGDFVMFNAYNLQIYMPLGFLGYIWREI